MADVGDAAAPTGLITLEDFLRRAHLASGREWPPPRHRPPPSPAHPPPAPPDTAYVLHCRTVPLASPPASPFFAIPLDGGGCVVADYGHDRLSVFCPRGSILRHIPCARPLGMALGDEAMHVAGADGLATLDLEGGVIRRVGGASESESGSASGDASAAASAPLLSRACGVAIDSAGSIYVSDSARHRVAVFSPTGAFVRAFGSGPAGGFGELDDPRGIAVRDGGVAGGRICHVYVADMCNHRVQVFSSDGSPRFVIGRHGDGACQFKYPCGVAFARGLLLVSEYVGGRVNVLTPHGIFLQVVVPPGGLYLTAVTADHSRALAADTSGAVHEFTIRRPAPPEAAPPPPPPNVAESRGEGAAGGAGRRGGLSEDFSGRDRRVAEAMQATDFKQMCEILTPTDMQALLPAAYAHAAAHPEDYPELS